MVIKFGRQAAVESLVDTYADLAGLELQGDPGSLTTCKLLVRSGWGDLIVASDSLGHLFLL